MLTQLSKSFILIHLYLSRQADREPLLIYSDDLAKRQEDLIVDFNLSLTNATPGDLALR